MHVNHIKSRGPCKYRLIRGCVCYTSCLMRSDNLSQKANSSTGYLYAVIATIALSLTAIIIRHLSVHYGLPALVTAFWRDAFAALILLAYLSTRKALLRVSRPDLVYLAGYGLLFSVFNIFWTLSVVQNGASVATVLVYSSAPFTAILGWWLLEEGLGLPKGLAILLSLAGCALVSLAGSSFQTNGLGLLIGIASGLCYAIYTLLGRKAAQRGLNPWTTSFYTFAFAAFYLLLFNLLPLKFIPGQAASPGEILWLGKAWSGWFFLFLLALVPTVLGFGFYNNALVILPSSVANMFLTIEPLFTALFAFWLFREQLNLTQMFGGLLTILGVLLISANERTHKTRKPAHSHA